MVFYSPAARDGRWRFNVGRRIAVLQPRFAMVPLSQGRFYEAGQIPVLTRLSDEMTPS